MRYLGGPLFVFYSYVFLSTSEWYKVLSVVFKKERVYLKTLYKIFIEKVMKREAIVGKGACKCGFLSFPGCKYRHLCMHTHLTTHYPNVHSLRGVLALLDQLSKPRPIWSCRRGSLSPADRWRYIWSPVFCRLDISLYFIACNSMWSMFFFTLWPVLLLTLVAFLQLQMFLKSTLPTSFLSPHNSASMTSTLLCRVLILMSPVCLSVVVLIVFFDLCICPSVGLLYCTTSWHRFCACFFQKGCTTVEDLNHFMAHFETEWRALDLHQMAIQWSLAADSVTCCCTVWRFLWLKSERNWDMRFILVVTH